MHCGLRDKINKNILHKLSEKINIQLFWVAYHFVEKYIKMIEHWSAGFEIGCIII